MQPDLSAMPRAEKLALLDALNERLARLEVETQRKDLISFAKAMYPGFSAGAHHRYIAKIFDDVLHGRKKRVIINIAPRHGKQVADDVPVLTLNRGWITHGELCVGDFVFSPSGKPVRVLAVSEKTPSDVRVEFMDGSVFWCHENHEWALYGHMPGAPLEVCETRRFLSPRKGRWGVTRGRVKQVLSSGRAIHFLPEVSPLEYPERLLPVHPYVLGAWLGDGTAGKPCVTHAAADAAYVDKLVACGYPRGAVHVHAKTKVVTTYLAPHPLGGRRAGALTRQLQALGCFEEKFIPEQYLHSSKEQRLELLAGLIDTDGSVDKHGRCRFVSANRALIDGVLELVRSLGWRAGATETQPSLSTSGIQGRLVYWAVGFNPTYPIPVALERKKFKRAPVARRIGLKSVEYAPCGKWGHCIQVDSADGLYLIGKTLVPTHNSLLASYLFPAWFIGHRPESKVLMATHTASLSEDFSRQVRNLVATPEYQRVFERTRLAEDLKGASAWETSAGGKYYAVGVGGSIAGRGADLCVIDDPHALEIDTPVATPFGFQTVENLRVGDFVFGPDGKPTKVLAKSQVWYDRELYAVTTDDDEVLYCDGAHLWTYHSETALAKQHLQKTQTARELAQWSRANAPYLPRHAAVEYPERALPVDPYVLGAWLGNGTASSGKMTSHVDDVAFMRAQFEAAGFATASQEDPHNFNALGLMPQLRALGVLGNKHIPEVYLTASVAQRVALLQGLMDTDGTVTAAGECSFQNTNRRLTVGVRELLHSLGFKARMRTYFDARMQHKTRQPDHRVNFRMAQAFRMPRKLARAYTSEDKRRRSIRVEPAGRRGAVQCITVDRPDGLFLAGRGYVVTHNSEQDVKTGSKLVFEQAWTWYQTGPRQRLQWGAAIVVLMTRWGLSDLTAKLIQHQINNPDADQWEVIEFPAILNEHTEQEKPLWPEKWSLEELRATRAAIDTRYWMSQYQQNPTSDVSAIIKREWWQPWTAEDPPPCSYVMMSIDTAYEAKETADYSAVTTWGIFYQTIETGRDSGKQVPRLIMLDAFKGRFEFPELKEELFAYWKEWQPDTVLIEKKAAGASLVQEFRRMGIPVSEYTPSRGARGQSNDKVSRANAVSDIFASGCVYAPDRRWAKEVIEECAAFPVGDHDDYVDTVVQALLRFRQGGFINLDSDEKDEPAAFRRRTLRPYY